MNKVWFFNCLTIIFLTLFFLMKCENLDILILAGVAEILAVLFEIKAVVIVHATLDVVSEDMAEKMKESIKVEAELEDL